MKRRWKGRRPALVTLVPSGRTIALLFAALTICVGLYLIARGSSLFALKTVEIRGAPPTLARKVRAAVEPFRGRSLVALNRASVEQAVLAIPEVRSVRIDRDFPNTLRVFVVREHTVAVLRRGAGAWLVASSGKVVRSFDRGKGLEMPRIWASSSVAVSEGQTIDDPGIRMAITVLDALRHFKERLHPTSVVAKGGNLTLFTGSDVELRFGNASGAALKLAVAEKILPQVPPASSGSVAYLDVSVPARPVSGEETKSSVSVGGEVSGSAASPGASGSQSDTGAAG
jgi:cell division protein FtsQ